MKIKRFIVWFLERACDKTHFIQENKFVYKLFPNACCWLAIKSFSLDCKWQTGEWDIK